MSLQKFVEGELIWAKLEDFPYWPARIASNSVTKELREFKNETTGIAVVFLGTPLTFGLVEETDMQEFKAHLAEHKKAKIPKELKKEFEEALNMAESNNEFVEPPLELFEEDRPAKKQKKEVSKKTKGEAVAAEKKEENTGDAKEEASTIVADEISQLNEEKENVEQIKKTSKPVDEKVTEVAENSAEGKEITMNKLEEEVKEKIDESMKENLAVETKESNELNQ